MNAVADAGHRTRTDGRAAALTGLRGDAGGDVLTWLTGSAVALGAAGVARPLSSAKADNASESPALIATAFRTSGVAGRGFIRFRSSRSALFMRINLKVNPSNGRLLVRSLRQCRASAKIPNAP